jgi:hypothetical protein
VSTTTRHVDPRGLRFSAALSTLVLAVVLVTENPYLLGFQVLAFGLGAALGPARSPYGLLFGYLIRPRLAPPDEPEPEAPPRFAQAVGLAFAVVALVGYLLGAGLFGAVAVGLALAAAFVNAAFGLCVGCEMYVLLLRLFRRNSPNDSPSAA